ncbi:DUF2087 domain-containing protein [Yoonia sediminilitoris]|uniref:Uncharacterized protein DUF2087 n=1 Tax=Yoonia sediminilitoris TaxID=1286148 RepID=A0A2T6KRV9_9RHOB|nr:DUF2087 domain-containing protein [Yoonia sediminilitoris]PUB19288.1 uncharacterized protein DUF2087 [Yoonia sediminilitoris]RCW99456.1 uncharacterized protein DUF2087 [Yoonia sediminilitoris]
MPKEMISITITDLSAFTKDLRNALIQRDELPGHATMLGVVAKAAGYENFQHLKAARPATRTPAQSKQLGKALRTFDNGIMIRWPKQTAIQGLCLWPFWAALPARTDLSEKQVNAILNAGHSFGDHALLRRSLVDHRMVQRTKDGKIYRRIEQAPPPDAKALMAAI